jgi:hypothetical protein
LETPDEFGGKMIGTEAQLNATGQFALQDGDTAPPVESWDQSNGLAFTASVGATILTGEAWGPITVAVDVHDMVPPDAADPLAFTATDQQWDDIVEISVICKDGPLRVCGLSEGFIEGLPPLGPGGPGSYRVRVHVSGRDNPTMDADGMPAPTDRFLLVAWPAPPRPQLLIRLTDWRGLNTRLSWLETREAPAISSGNHPEPPPAPSPI